VTADPGVIANEVARHPSSFPLGQGFLTPQAAAEFLGCDIVDLKSFIESGQLPAYRQPSGNLVFSLSDLQALPQGISPKEAMEELAKIYESNAHATTMVVSAAASPVTGMEPGNALDRFSRVIDELRRASAQSPQWLDIEDAVTCFGIPAKTLKTWAGEGLVRKAKLGPTLQSKSLYNASDISDILCRIAAGKPPVSAHRKAL
jgi:hypothetical protein